MPVSIPACRLIFSWLVFPASIVSLNTFSSLIPKLCGLGPGFVMLNVIIPGLTSVVSRLIAKSFKVTFTVCPSPMNIAVLPAALLAGADIPPACPGFCVVTTIAVGGPVFGGGTVGARRAGGVAVMIMGPVAAGRVALWVAILTAGTAAAVAVAPVLPRSAKAAPPAIPPTVIAPTPKSTARRPRGRLVGGTGAGEAGAAVEREPHRPLAR